MDDVATTSIQPNAPGCTHIREGETWKVGIERERESGSGEWAEGRLETKVEYTQRVVEACLDSGVGEEAKEGKREPLGFSLGWVDLH